MFEEMKQKPKPICISNSHTTTYHTNLVKQHTPQVVKSIRFSLRTLGGKRLRALLKLLKHLLPMKDNSR